MFYGIIMVLIILILFLMRKRIIGGIVVSTIFVGTIFFIIFLMDWYVGVDLRQYTDISWYDKTIENPVEVGRDVANTTGEQLGSINDQLIEQGDKLDDKFGIEIESDSTDDTTAGYGIWGEDTKVTQESNNNNQSSNQPPQTTTDQSTMTVQYGEVNQVIQSIPLSDKDKQLLTLVSPHNPGTFEGEAIRLETTRESVTIIY